LDKELRKRIKIEIRNVQEASYDAVDNAVVGDCPTRSCEGRAKIDEAVGKLLTLLDE
jgi:hypothetical protein